MKKMLYLLSCTCPPYINVMQVCPFLHSFQVCLNSLLPFYIFFLDFHLNFTVGIGRKNTCDMYRTDNRFLGPSMFSRNKVSSLWAKASPPPMLTFTKLVKFVFRPVLYGKVGIGTDISPENCQAPLE